MTSKLQLVLVCRTLQGNGKLWSCMVALQVQAACASIGCKHAPALMHALRAAARRLTDLKQPAATLCARLPKVQAVCAPAGPAGVMTAAVQDVAMTDDKAARVCGSAGSLVSTGLHAQAPVQPAAGVVRALPARLPRCHETVSQGKQRCEFGLSTQHHPMRRSDVLMLPCASVQVHMCLHMRT